MEREIRGTTKVCGLLGNPVHHTLSPAIHNTLAGCLDFDLAYVPFEVKNESLEDAVRGALALEILGLNVTIPHKNAVIPFLKEIDDQAAELGAVNTLVRTKAGDGYKGYNTDYYGLKRSFEQAGVALKGASVIILGSGGVARPAAYLCVNEGAKEIFILNRTVEKAEELAEQVNRYAENNLCKAMSVTEYGILPGDRKYICFQMTSVGLYPNDADVIIEDMNFYSLLSAGFDAVYRPLKTAFLKKCEEAGAKTIDGLHMLMYQGVEAFELWNDINVPEKYCSLVYGKLLGCLAEDKNIILTGFMGSGKTAVSRKLAELTGFDVIDTDQLIESEQGRTISDIFSKEGEEFFRDLETQTLENIINNQKKKLIISVGGGLPIREKNRELMKKIGQVIWLKASPETVYERVKNDSTRPLLKTDDVLGTIRKLQKDRSSVYESAADKVISTDNKTIEEIAIDVLS